MFGKTKINEQEARFGPFKKNYFLDRERKERHIENEETERQTDRERENVVGSQ